MPFVSGLHLRRRASRAARLHRLRDALGEDVDEIAIGARQQARRHLDDGDRAAERGVDRCRARGRCSRRRRRAATSGCRADRARAVESITRGSSSFSVGGIAGSRSGREDRVLELQLSPRRRRAASRAACARRRSRRSPGCTAPCAASRAGRCRCVSRLTTLFLNSRSLSRSIFGSPNSTPHAFAWRDSSISLRDVQQRLRRNAAAVDADAAGIRFGIDERDAAARDRRRETRRRSRPGPPPTTTSWVDISEGLVTKIETECAKQSAR